MHFTKPVSPGLLPGCSVSVYPLQHPGSVTNVDPLSSCENVKEIPHVAGMGAQTVNPAEPGQALFVGKGVNSGRRSDFYSVTSLLSWWPEDGLLHPLLYTFQDLLSLFPPLYPSLLFQLFQFKSKPVHLLELEC